MTAISYGAQHGEGTLKLLGGMTVDQPDRSVLVISRFTLKEWPAGRVETGIWRIGARTDGPNIYAVNHKAMLYSSWPPFPVAPSAEAQAEKCITVEPEVSPSG
jgi:hypothetical protein